MPTFYYKARKGPAELLTGYLEADNLAQAVAQLNGQGKIPVEVLLDYQVKKPAEKLKKQSSLAVSRKALVAFTRQMADLLESGIVLLRAVDICSRQRQYPQLKEVLESIKAGIQSGASLSMCLSNHPRIFSPLYVQTVKASEQSGRLPFVLAKLAKYLEQDLATRQKVMSSLLYPSIIFAVGVLTIIILLTFVLPRITIMFDDIGAQLPLATRAVMGLSYVFEKAWWVLLLLGMGIFVWGKQFLSTDKGRQWLDRMIFKVPVLKTYWEHVQVARFSATLGMLLESGVNVTSALESTANVVDNTYVAQEINAIALKVRGGQSLASAIKSSPFFPQEACDLVAVGQESGRIERGLYQLEHSAQEQANAMSQVFVTILGPGVLIAVVAIVGFLMISLLLPIFSMNLMIN